jgi:hypothetical protein
MAWLRSSPVNRLVSVIETCLAGEHATRRGPVQ